MTILSRAGVTAVEQGKGLNGAFKIQSKLGEKRWVSLDSLKTLLAEQREKIVSKIKECEDGRKRPTQSEADVLGLLVLLEERTK
jgi:hypothetical protein